MLEIIVRKTTVKMKLEKSLLILFATTDGAGNPCQKGYFRLPTMRACRKYLECDDFSDIK